MQLAASILLTVLLFLFLPNFMKIFLNAKKSLLAILSIIIILSYLNMDYDRNEFKRYLSGWSFLRTEAEAWLWLNKQTKDSIIAYTGRDDAFPLYGTHFKNKVIYVSVNKTHPARLHYFPFARYDWNSDLQSMYNNLEKNGNYRENPNYEIWLHNLKVENIDYIVIYSLFGLEKTAFPIEDKWAQTYPQIFNLAFSNEDVHIYRIIK